ncbi:ABC transporter ATP-binding protein [Curtobacterium sp. MCSS17_008]|uniref:ABC transporter ATP-binding protein n=1 Tax=Curtobacterium sp. MCSS17_008 TaxID=2175647 RepID=UPI000DA73104|nr:ABC transporter ATP-binding protein [Curtobacterium sp. MCSS17_008]PZF58886.1 ABC transporter ATP-binding protein [Curtobacterium sp. MCSS17_008]
MTGPTNDTTNDTPSGAPVTIPTTPTTTAPATEAGRASRPVYRLQGVRKTYTQKNRTVTALTDVDLTIPQGQLVAIQGPTGGGKSTLLQMLGALDRPTSGKVLLGEHDVTELGDRALTDLRATEIGFVFQGFNLIPTLSALENVETAFAGSLANRSKAEVRSRATAALQEVGLGERLDHLPAELSGGQQQRVAIARALVKDPSVLLADEPTGALDESTRDEITAIIEKQWRERGLTVVIVTHDSWVAKRAERRLRIEQGRVREL